MRALKHTHIAIGIIGIVVFVLTGQYMAIFLRGLIEMPDGPRLMYRTSHLYLMWASLVNLVVGAAFVVAKSRSTRIVQVLSSIALFAGPVLMLSSFFVESHRDTLQRTLSDFGNYLALGGVILHVAVTHLPRRNETAAR